MTKGLLPEGYTLRNATWDDLQPVVDLIYAVCEHDGDVQVATSKEEMREIWEDPKLNIDTDTFVVTDPNGNVVGYEEFYNRNEHAALIGDGYVHPAHLGKGIGTALLRALDERARTEIAKADPELRVYIHNGMAIGDTISREMHENEGYQPIRFFWRMEIELEDAPPTPVFPENIELRPFDEATHAELVHAAHEEAFSDHWGHTVLPFEEWKRRVIETHEYNPELWFIAWDGDEIAGYSICRYRNDNGWVGSLGVRRPWRKKGLGLALLYHSFNEFCQRGQMTIGLGVDASNPTGATRLYERAGMRIGSEYVTYEKEFRAGRELDE